MLKKIIAATLIAGSVGNAYAVCPANLNGNWAGTTVEQSAGTITDDSGNSNPISSVQYDVMSFTVSGSTVTPTYYADASSGVFGSGSVNTSGFTPMTFTYNKAGCYGSISDGNGTWNFIVTDSGKTIHGVLFQSDNMSFGANTLKGGTAKKFTLTRQ